MKPLPTACLALALALLSAAAHAVVPLRYEKIAFDRAVAAGSPVAVHFSAVWCPTCQAQKPVIQQILTDPELRNLKFFVADYDREMGLRNKLAVQRQSTLVVFKGGFEAGRSTGDTNRDTLARLFKRAVDATTMPASSPSPAKRP